MVDAVDEALAARGLVLVEGGSDLLVVYHAAIGRVVDVANMTRGYGYGEGRGASVNYVREYDLGTLVIDLVSAESKQLVWRGSGPLSLDHLLRIDEDKEPDLFREA